MKSVRTQINATEFLQNKTYIQCIYVCVGELANEKEKKKDYQRRRTQKQSTNCKQ
jgi:hypothetical protein